MTPWVDRSWNKLMRNLLFIVNFSLTLTTRTSKGHIYPLPIQFLKMKFMTVQKMEMFCEKGVFENFSIFTGKHLCQSFFLIQQLYQKETPTQVQVFSRKY